MTNKKINGKNLSVFVNNMIKLSKSKDEIKEFVKDSGFSTEVASEWANEPGKRDGMEKISAEKIDNKTPLGGRNVLNRRIIRTSVVGMKEFGFHANKGKRTRRIYA